MKKFVIGIFAIIFFASCSKGDAVVAPEQTKPINNIYFKDGNISVANLNVTNSGKAIKLSFVTLYETNIAKIEVMSGITSSSLCKIYEQNVTAMSNQAKAYSVTEGTPAAQVMYYAIRYTLKNGDWAMSPVYKYISQN